VAILLHACPKRQLARATTRALQTTSKHAVHAERHGEADDLLAVKSEGWQALADAMSDELFDRLKRWHAPARRRIGSSFGAT
jgi:hypothetical protein